MMQFIKGENKLATDSYNHLGSTIKVQTSKPTIKGPTWRLFLAGFVLVAGSLALLYLRLCMPYQEMPSLLHQSASMDQLYSNTSDKDRVVVCYYVTPRLNSTYDLKPADVHPYLCTHINVAFACVVNDQVSMEDFQYTVLKEIVQLKVINPSLKILLSIGGANNGDGFSKMVFNHANRKTFIKSVRDLLRKYKLDGIDLDWEFPAVHNVPDHAQSKMYKSHVKIEGRERQHFSQLLREIREEYIREKRNYLLTVAVAAPQIIVDAAYDVDQINNYVDFVNIMSYDYHFFSSYTPFTGLNSPIYPRSLEQLYMATLNVNYTVNMYIDKGLDQSKIVVGIPTYGHTFTLVNINNNKVDSPAAGFGSLGSHGYVLYPEICHFAKEFKLDVQIVRDEFAKVPYLFRSGEWVSFDTPVSVAEKAEYIKENKLRGAMIYSLNADDFTGVCEEPLGAKVKFPLLHSVKNVLFAEHYTSVTSEGST